MVACLHGTSNSQENILHIIFKSTPNLCNEHYFNISPNDQMHSFKTTTISTICIGRHIETVITLVGNWMNWKNDLRVRNTISACSALCNAKNAENETKKSHVSSNAVNCNTHTHTREWMKRENITFPFTLWMVSIIIIIKLLKDYYFSFQILIEE